MILHHSNDLDPNLDPNVNLMTLTLILTLTSFDTMTIDPMTS